MRQRILAFAFVMFVLSPAFGQKEKTELFLLHGVLKVPQATPVAFKTSSALPDKSPLKIFVATNTEFKVRSDFLGWFREWNEGEGQKYGLVEVVTDFSSADIGLVRITDPTVRMGDHETTYGASSEIDPATRQPVNTPTIPSATKFAVNVYGYVIVKDGDGLVALRHYTDSIEVTSTLRTLTGGSGNDWARAQRAVQIALNDGTLNSKGRKDKKMAGDKLRDEFFKIMKARGGKK